MHLPDHLLVYSLRSRKKVGRFLADVGRAKRLCRDICLRSHPLEGHPWSQRMEVYVNPVPCQIIRSNRQYLGIFIIEGAITCGVCLFGWFIIIDFPTKADKFLKPEEKQFIIDRINYDRGDAEEDPMTLARILHHLKDWKLYFWAFNLMASTLPGYAFSYFKTIILKEGMGWSTTTSQLLSAPPYVFAAAITYFSGWLTDKYRIRGPIIAVHQLLTCIGMVIMAYGGANGARYFGIFLGVGALQYCIPGVLAFQANNITSHSKRGVASATCLIGGGLGGIIASVAFKSSESPQYTTGIWVTFGISIASIIMTAIMDVYFIRMNRRAKEGGLQLEGMSDWYYTL